MRANRANVLVRLEDEPTVLQEPVRPPRVEHRRAAHVLALIQGGNNERFLLEGAELILGRGEDADLKVASTELSRRHLLFRARDDEYLCEDLDSKNGVYLNGVRIHRALLRDRDELQMGSLIFIYYER